jgi:hypothetical protein
MRRVFTVRAKASPEPAGPEKEARVVTAPGLPPGRRPGILTLDTPRPLL